MDDLREKEKIADEVESMAGFLMLLSDAFHAQDTLDSSLYKTCLLLEAVSAVDTARRLRELLEG